MTDRVYLVHVYVSCITEVTAGFVLLPWMPQEGNRPLSPQGAT